MAIQNRVRAVGIQGALSRIKLRYLAIAHAPLQVTAPSRNVYEVYGGVDFQVAEQDMAWFLSRRDERGRSLYQVVSAPLTPAPAPTPISELPFAVIEEIQAEPLEIDIEGTKETPKRTRKQKTIETQEAE